MSKLRVFVGSAQQELDELELVEQRGTARVTYYLLKTAVGEVMNPQSIRN